MIFDGCVFDETVFDAVTCVTPPASSEPNRRRARTMLHINRVPPTIPVVDDEGEVFHLF